MSIYTYERLQSSNVSETATIDKFEHVSYFKMKSFSITIMKAGNNHHVSKLTEQYCAHVCITLQQISLGRVTYHKRNKIKGYRSHS